MPRNRKIKMNEKFASAFNSCEMVDHKKGRAAFLLKPAANKRVKKQKYKEAEVRFQAKEEKIRELMDKVVDVLEEHNDNGLRVESPKPTDVKNQTLTMSGG